MPHFEVSCDSFSGAEARANVEYPRSSVIPTSPDYPNNVKNQIQRGDLAGFGNLIHLNGGIQPMARRASLALDPSDESFVQFECSVYLMEYKQ